MMKRIRQRSGTGHSSARSIIYGTTLLSFLFGIMTVSYYRQETSQLLFVSPGAIQRILNERSYPRYPLTMEQNSEGTTSGKYKPVSCSSYLGQIRSRTLQVDDPNGGVLYGKQVETDPKFWISLHNKGFDVTRWSIHDYGHYYEKALTFAFQQVLSKASPGARVIDVGGNIGFFTLLSAANGPVTVDTFEPNIKNRLRLCESLHLNQWYSEYDGKNKYGPTEASHVNLYPLGVGKEEGVQTFEEHPNPGMGKFKPGGSNRQNGTDTLQVISLDSFAKNRDWFQSRPEIAVLKVDVEGAEYSVIEGAVKLLKSGMVKNIFMEVSARTKLEQRKNIPALSMLSHAGYKLHKVGGWRGPDRDVPFSQDSNIAQNIMQTALNEHAKQLNLWWVLEE